MITVKKIKEEMFEVIVKSKTSTTHKVTVRDEYYKKLTNSKVPVEVLVKESFEFLLERESNTSILRTFELSVIGYYFPEYERLISERLKNR